MKVGLIVNPIAGIGGRVGLKGSDGSRIVAEAVSLGAVPPSPARAIEALQGFGRFGDGLDLVTYPFDMGQEEAAACGLKAHIVGSIKRGRTSAEDTKRAAMDLVAAGAKLLVFAGGDGTARDLCDVVSETLPVLGIPAGVKMHSSVFAVYPKIVPALVEGFFLGSCSVRAMEVMDIDEEAFRQGSLRPRLYGYLNVPYEIGKVQGAKSSNLSSEESLEAIAQFVVDTIDDSCCYVLGPGTTVRAIGQKLGIDKTLLGVDVVLGHRLMVKDASEDRILSQIKDRKAKVIVTVIGGQGYILGRGNQQISPRVLRMVGKENLLVVATRSKLLSLPGPLLVDSGDDQTDAMLSGYIRVLTGYNEESIWKVVSQTSK